MRAELSRLRAFCLLLGLLWCLGTPSAQAQDADHSDFSGLGAAPFSDDIRRQYYEILRRSPAKAFLWDLALPGAGSVYTRLYANAIVTGVVSVAGAALWIAGAAKHDDALWWAGAGTFAAGRVYGLVSAPVGASLLNAAFRRHFGIISD